jgi:hypothetical protein
MWNLKEVDLRLLGCGGSLHSNMHCPPPFRRPTSAVS